MYKYLEFFYDIADIPHGSGNTHMISEYLVCFAKERGLYYRKDEYNNVVIIKEAAAGYEACEPIILQAHMDMVCVKTAECDKDMSSQGLDLKVKDNRLFAKDTSLGGDDGIGLSYILAILDGNYPSPRIEAIFTSDEEIGMVGAAAFNPFDIEGRRMINLDEENEGGFVAGCAGGASIEAKIKVDKEVYTGFVFSVTLEGLKGGHSGIDINCGRGNAIKVLAEELCKLNSEIAFNLIEIEGGSADNAIPYNCSARIMLTRNDNPLFRKRVMMNNGQDFYFGDEKDPDCGSLKIEECGSDSMIALTEESTENVLNYLANHPYGVISMDEEISDAVKTSINLGIVKSDEEFILTESLARSSVNAEKDALIYELCKLIGKHNGSYKITSSYPGWPVSGESKLRELMVKVYEEMTLCKPTVGAIHAGLECGLLSEKIKGLDCLAIGPDIRNVHSFNEYVSLESADRTFDYLVKVLEELR